MLNIPAHAQSPAQAQTCATLCTTQSLPTSSILILSLLLIWDWWVTGVTHWPKRPVFHKSHVMGRAQLRAYLFLLLNFNRWRSFVCPRVTTRTIVKNPGAYVALGSVNISEKICNYIGKICNYIGKNQRDQRLIRICYKENRGTNTHDALIDLGPT